MISITFDDKKFMREMQNIVKYSEGFLDGAKAGKPQMMKNLAISTIEMLKDFVDMSARMDPQNLHHVYEWYQVGSPDARLFDIDYIVSAGGISINSSFRQSVTASAGSSTPFYDKARIMEQGIPVVIKPRKAKVLAFSVDGEQVFSKSPIVVDHPGGQATQGAYEETFKTFFDRYFNQSFLHVTGIYDSIKDVSTFKHNLASGSRSGKSTGYNTGYKWISKIGAIKE